MASLWASTPVSAVQQKIVAPERVNSERLLLWTLLTVYVFNFLDRQIVSILAEPIKNDLGLSDTQLGLMTGLAFALFYVTLGIPIARYADRPTANRVGLISLSLSMVMTMEPVAARKPATRAERLPRLPTKRTRRTRSGNSRRRCCM